MTLDIRTIMVMTAIFSFMFSALLALAGYHAGRIRGMRQWAMANLLIGLGLGLAYYFDSIKPGFDWAILLGATLLALGLGLNFVGIQAFKEERIDLRLPALLMVLVVTQTAWFTLIHPDIPKRAIGNSLLFAFAYAACARALFVRVEPPLKTAFWFTGASFAINALMLLLRVVVILRSAPGAYSIYAHVPLNPMSFFVGSIVQLCVTFGFILMLNYRLILDIRRIEARDLLTGALTRRRLEEEALRLKARSERTGDPLAIMMLDVDRFKSVNDRYGHPVGDEVLRRLADVIHKFIRADDYFGRYGGEEFCILLPSTSEREALALAERLRGAYAALSMELNGVLLTSTVSIGVADSTTVGLEFRALVAAADEALYRAKQDGRNCVVPCSILRPLRRVETAAGVA